MGRRLRRSALATVMGLMATLVGCARRAPTGERVEAPARAPAVPPTADSAACRVEPSPAARLSARERCVLAAYQARCHTADACLIRCLARGQGRNIGGGCWHVCHAYGGGPMTPQPPGMERCAALPDTGSAAGPLSRAGRSNDPLNPTGDP